MFKTHEIVKDKFWIVMSTHGKVGTLRRVESGYELFDQRDNSTRYFSSFDEAFTEKSKNMEEDRAGSLAEINGFSTGKSKVYPVEDDMLPLFKKTKNGKAVYAAGYYLIQFSGMGWQSAFSPKLSTLHKYNYRGPFLTEWEMNLELRKYRRNYNGENI
jgi:hypothetical protein